MELLPRRWPRRQDDSLEVEAGLGDGLGERKGALVGGTDDSDALVSKRERRGDWN